MGEIALKTANSHHQQPKNNGLGKAVGDIVYLGAGHDPGEVGTRIDPQQQTAADPGADDADQVNFS